MNGYTEVEKQPLPGGNVNQPASGTYGEGVALDRLKKQFPSAAGGEGEGGLQPSAPPQIDPTKVGGTPPDLGGRPDTGGAAPPPGIPAAILHPTQEPNVPVGTPLAVDTPRP
ncbi:MAG TPA: hypothetical protein VD926_11490, partial [Acidimicrobiales bacterium]|nr:hypothetical protein [Acidimicrobiales bacterium]